jgi:hypothetical protein
MDQDVFHLHAHVANDARARSNRILEPLRIPGKRMPSWPWLVDSLRFGSRMTVSSSSSAPGRWRRRARWLAAAVLVLVLLAGGGRVGTWALQARAVQDRVVVELRDGGAALQRGKTAVAAATPANLAPLQTASAAFSAARQHFLAAERLATGDPSLSGLALVPALGYWYVSPRLQTVIALARTGVALADTGGDTVALDDDLLTPGRTGLGAGERMIAFLRGSGPRLAAIRDHVDRALGAARQVRLDLVPEPERTLFAKSIAQLGPALGGLDAFARLAAPLLAILGANGPRTYLFEQVDPAELRGGGGFIGSYSLLTVDHGAISLSHASDVYLIDHPYPDPGSPRFVAPPGPLRQFADHGWVFGDANFSPDFATAAREGETLLRNETGLTVDGVISIDPWAVAALLGVTGPIAVPEYHDTVSAAAFPEDVFQRLETISGNLVTKKDFFPAVAAKVIDRITTLPGTEWARLVGALNAAVTQRHLQVYFNDADAEAQMVAIGWAGPAIAQKPAANETVMEVESNFAGDKANHFLARSYALDLTVDGSKLRHRLTVTWQNSTPDGYEGGRDYTVYLRMYLPPGAADTATSGLQPDRLALDERPANAWLVDGWAQVKTGQTGQASVSWTTPLGDPAAGAHSLYWQKQAGTLTDQVRVTVHDGPRVTSAAGDLGQDRLVVLDGSGVQIRPGTSGAATVPFLGA